VEIILPSEDEKFHRRLISLSEEKSISRIFHWGAITRTIATED